MKFNLKRIFDILVSIAALCVLSPLIMSISLILFINGNKVIFIQERPGHGGKLFNFFKFCTMNNKIDESGELLPDKNRITKIGGFLRETSLDELPSLLNVVLGNMSIVGPRPLLKEYLTKYSKQQHKRHNVKPGITGWAQINGRNKIPWGKKFEYDLWYVKNHSLFLDLKIIAITLWQVLKRDGVYHKGNKTMPYFKGEDYK